MKLYTKGGDEGLTSLIGGERVSKDDIRVDAYGTVDELSAFIAMLGDSMIKDNICEFEVDIDRIECRLMDIEALLALSENSQKDVKKVDIEDIKWLESKIDELQSQTESISYFTIPGGNFTMSISHVARTVCRRAERLMVKVAKNHALDGNAIIYINRLSDYLYALSRVLVKKLNVKEKIWIP
ncbi:MAG: cob(I)yrinic acid a,c-diamide adenosyltransferase [Alistipes sp.]|nr:cob(I)yrinic acid a,c-diamide adenosyltransferase [Candidatus Alistipes equi]